LTGNADNHCVASAAEHHCPFLNRSDARCSDAFSLESLEHTYQFCFGRYKACPTYLELLVERRLRRSAAAAAAAVAMAGRAQRSGDANSDESAPPAEQRPAQSPRFVPLTVSVNVNPAAISAALAHGHAQRAA
jgi:hypothetical protein